MADKKDSTSSVLDFVANLVSRGDAKGVDSAYGSIVRDKVNKSDLSPEEESVVGKIAKKFGQVLKIGAFAESPEARRLPNTPVSGVKGTEAIKDKTATIDAGKAKSEKGLFSSILGTIGSALGKMGGIAAIAGIAAIFILKDSIVPILQTLTTFFIKVLDKMPRVLEAIGAAIPPIIDSLGPFFASVLEKMPPIISAIGAAIPPIIDSLGLFFSSTLEKMPPIIDSLFNGLSKLSPVITTLFDELAKADWSTLGKAGVAILGLGAIGALVGKMGLWNMAKGAAGLALLGGALLIVTKALDPFSKLDWETLGKAGAAIGGLGVIGTVLGKIGLGNMIKGAVGITLLSGALFALSKALDPFSKLDWDTIGKAGTALAGLGIIGSIFGKIGVGTLAKGAAGLTLLGGALWVLGEKGLKPFASLDWSILAIGLTTVAGFGILGGIAGIFAPKLLLGALAIGAIGLALIPFAKAADIAAPGIEKIIGAFSNFYGNILEKMPPLVEEIGILITGVIDSISGGVNSMIDTLSGGVTRVLDGVKGIIKESGDTIVNIANGVSDSISRFFDKLADTILKLNGVDTAKLKEIGPALSSIGSGLLAFGGKGFIGNVLSGLGSLFGADSPLEKFQKLGEVAPKIQSLPKALEELSKYTNFKFLNEVDIDASTTSIKNLNDAAWNLKGTLQQLRDVDVQSIVNLSKFTPDMVKLSNSAASLRSNEVNPLKDFTEEKIEVLSKINNALLNLITTTTNLRNTSLATLTDSKDLNLFGIFNDNRTVTSINEVNTALLNLLSTQEKLKANSRDIENIKGSFDIKTINTVSDTNIKNLTTDTTEYHNFAKTAMQDQIKRQDVMIDLLKQLVMKPTGGTSINTNNGSMQEIPSKPFNIREQFNPYTMIPNNFAV